MCTTDTQVVKENHLESPLLEASEFLGFNVAEFGSMAHSPLAHKWDCRRVGRASSEALHVLSARWTESRYDD
eukprot:SAG25_NODE_1484_length_2931_cov_3.076271_4_plen_72_part_00